MLVENTLTTEEIVRAVSGILMNGDMGIPFKGISTDTRTLEPGYIFWALKGKNFDGHDFWKEALAKGARGLLIHRIPSDMKLEELPKTISVILVKDTLYALGELARYHRTNKGFKVIAITGSCGKTTTKEMLSDLLESFYRVAKNEANYNNLIGVPLSILGIKNEPDWVILEIGTSEKGEIRRLTEIAGPLISVITCIHPAHLEGLGTLEGVLEEKVSLFEGTKPDGTLIYYYDQELLRERVKRFNHKKISFGEKEGADLCLISYSEEPERARFAIQYQGRVYQAELPIFGKHNLLNLLAGLSAGLATGLSLEALIEALPKDRPLYMRTRFIDVEPWLIIDDTYNANPGSMREALKLLASRALADETKIAILGDMKELGEASRELHEEIGKVASEFADRAIFIGEMAEHYARGFSLSGKPFEIYETVEDFLERGDLPRERLIILIKGSRSLRMERIVQKLMKRRHPE